MIYFASGKILYTQRHTHTECGAISVGVKGCSKVSAQLTWVQIGGSSSRSGASKALSTPAAASGWELNYSQGCLWSRCKQSHPWDAGHVPSLIAALWPQSSGMLGVPGRALRRKGSEEDRAGQEKQPSKDVTFAAWSLGGGLTPALHCWAGLLYNGSLPVGCLSLGMCGVISQARQLP